VGAERGQCLGREIRPGQRADHDPGSVADHLRDPTLDVVGRPRISERVDVHHTTLALVVEAERLGLARGAPGERQLELLERRDEQIAIRRCATRDEVNVHPRRDPVEGARLVENRPSCPRRSARDDVLDEVPDDGDERHRRRSYGSALLPTIVAEMRLFDLRVTVERIEGRSVCGLEVGDYFEVTESSRIRIPEGRHFCIYALQSVLPLLAAKQRQLPESDWLELDSHVACPDPDERVVMRIERIGERTLRTEDLT
jgi:uncharacterized repeat protein (TIGR04076 family)